MYIAAPDNYKYRNIMMMMMNAPCLASLIKLWLNYEII